VGQLNSFVPPASAATFPPALASRCIQAGTSERGCCAACGAPWERVVETPVWPRGEKRPKLGAHPLADDLAGGAYQAFRNANPPTTVGWQPSCDCFEYPVPCTVLDPFGGSGTVGAVAEQLGRHSILVELSPEYVRMAERRTAQRGLFTYGGADRLHEHAGGV
jgi:DNA methylase